METILERDEIESQLNKALSTCRLNGLAANEAEVQYRIKKTQEILRLKSEGYPTTLIPEIVKGLPEVAVLYQDKLDKEVIYKSNIEAIQVKKLELRSKEAELEREWNSARNY